MLLSNPITLISHPQPIMTKQTCLEKATTILSLLSFVVGITEIALEVTVKNNFSTHAKNRGSSWPQYNYPHPSHEVSLIPAHLITSVTELIIWTGAMAITTGVLGGLRCLMVSDVRSSQDVRICLNHKRVRMTDSTAFRKGT